MAIRDGSCCDPHNMVALWRTRLLVPRHPVLAADPRGVCVVGASSERCAASSIWAAIALLSECRVMLLERFTASSRTAILRCDRSPKFKLPPLAL